MKIKEIFEKIFFSKNNINIKTYNTGIDDYVKKSHKTIEGNKKIWIDTAVGLIKKTDFIFEIGSGPGVDADYMENAGYQVIRSDASEGFIKYQKNLGKESIFYDVSQKTKISDTFQLVYCNLVLQHFPKSELQKILKNISTLIKIHGYFAIGMKLGEGEKWEYDKLRLPRYFSYYSEREFEDEMMKAGYKKVFSIIKDEIYLNTIFQKL